MERETDVQRKQTLMHKISLLYRSGPPNNGCCTCGWCYFTLWNHWNWQATREQKYM